MSLAKEFTIGEDFPPASYAEWRSMVEADLQGVPFEKKLVARTYEGIDIQPVYTRQDFAGEADPQGFPGMRPFIRGSKPLGHIGGIDLRQQYDDSDITTANRAILADLAGGVTSLELRFDAAARQGFDPDEKTAANLVGQRGIMAYCADDFASVLAGVDLQLAGVALDAGAAYLPSAAMLVAVWKRHGVALDTVCGAFNADPLEVLAREGQLPLAAEIALKQLADLAKWSAANCPQLTAVGVDTSPYHDAGATATQDLAIGLATGVEYLRAMTATGMEIDSAARQILFRLCVGTHSFRAIAKLRAARKLWERVVEVAGGSVDSRAMRMQVRVGERVLTERDPYLNILRNTTALFAACLGGADVISSLPLDRLIGSSDESTRRVARNTWHILEEEAHLNRVIDPAGGSWFLDKLTNEFATESWRFFQEIEQRGGMLAVLESGWLADEIEKAFAPRAKDIARRKQGITGVSEFPNVAEERISRLTPDLSAFRRTAAERMRETRLIELSGDDFSSAASCTAAAVDAAERGATVGQMAKSLGFHNTSTTVKPILPRSFAKPFEELRDATDLWQHKHGSRPRVFLAAMGPVSHHTARATYAKNFFEAGGFEVVSNDGFRESSAAAEAFVASGASIAVICSSDKLYPEVVPDVAAKLKAAGARSVVLAGNPGDNETAWRAAGVDRFIFMKCDVLTTLRELLHEEGVWQS